MFVVQKPSVLTLPDVVTFAALQTISALVESRRVTLSRVQLNLKYALMEYVPILCAVDTILLNASAHRRNTSVTYVVIS